MGVLTDDPKAHAGGLPQWIPHRKQEQHATPAPAAASNDGDKKDKKDKKGKKDKGKTRDIEYLDDDELPPNEQELRNMYEVATRGISDEEILSRGQQSFQRGMAVKAEILEGCKWLVAGAKSGDSLFFHYSGHGVQVKDTSGDEEEDGFDEAICPADFRASGVIVDDDLHEIMVKNLPEGVKLTALMDCCHSGTGMDLAYIYAAKS